MNTGDINPSTVMNTSEYSLNTLGCLLTSTWVDITEYSRMSVEIMSEFRLNSVNLQSEFSQPSVWIQSTCSLNTFSNLFWIQSEFNLIQKSNNCRRLLQMKSISLLLMSSTADVMNRSFMHGMLMRSLVMGHLRWVHKKINKCHLITILCFCA